jgi:predicted amidohydrolase YtcJ
MLQGVVQRADSAGLQCAIHAIGDKAIRQAINVLSEVGTPGRRHRIEHLELSTTEDAKRLGQLGITASIQPVHSDPTLFKAWPSLVGPHRCKRAFAYKDFLDGGAPIAIGTDAPTARHLPFPNLYNATTRRSALEPESTDTVNPHFGITLAQAATAATTGAAYARFADSWTGSLKEGMKADFLVVDMQWNPETLLEAKVSQTWYLGKKIYDSKLDAKV